MASTKVLIFGLDKAGKTALSNFIKNETSLPTRPTLAFNIDKWVIKGMEFQIWDAPGQVKLRSVWKNAFNKAQVLFFVVDLSIPDRFQESKTEFDKVLQDSETRGLSLIFCFHKTDKSDAMENLNEARTIFKLPQIADRKVFTYQTSIYDPASIKPIKEKLIVLVQEARW